MAVTTAAANAYLGALFQAGKRPNTFLRLCGYFAGRILTTSSIEFPTGVQFSLRSPSQAARLEGANAPNAETVGITQATNVVQLIQETVSTTYLAQSDKTISGTVPLPQGSANGSVVNPRSEVFQIAARMETISQDLNFSFLNGVYAKPADPTAAALKSRGVLTAITTNYVDSSGDTISTTNPHKQYRDYVEATLLSVVTTSGYSVDETFVIMAGTTEYANIAKAYENKGTQYLMPETTVVGVKVRSILTTFGTLILALDPDMPAQKFAILNMGVCAPVGLEVPGKGILFPEALAKSGSSDNTQIYGQMGLDHGPEFLHGLRKVPSGWSL